jgi:hypothetical protein
VVKGARLKLWCGSSRGFESLSVQPVVILGAQITAGAGAGAGARASLPWRNISLHRFGQKQAHPRVFAGRRLEAGPASFAFGSEAHTHSRAPPRPSRAPHPTTAPPALGRLKGARSHSNPPETRMPVQLPSPSARRPTLPAPKPPPKRGPASTASLSGDQYDTSVPPASHLLALTHNAAYLDFFLQGGCLLCLVASPSASRQRPGSHGPPEAPTLSEWTPKEGPTRKFEPARPLRGRAARPRRRCRPPGTPPSPRPAGSARQLPQSSRGRSGR